MATALVPARYDIFDFLSALESLFYSKVLHAAKTMLKVKETIMIIYGYDY